MASVSSSLMPPSPFPTLSAHPTFPLLPINTPALVSLQLPSPLSPLQPHFFFSTHKFLKGKCNVILPLLLGVTSDSTVSGKST